MSLFMLVAKFMMQKLYVTNESGQVINWVLGASK
jgi:hypothetical protein